MNHRGTETQRDTLTEKVIGLAIQVHRTLGPGLLESVYQSCLCHELAQHGLRFKSEIELPVLYKGMKLDQGFRIDILVEDSLILELKTVEQLRPIHEAQLLTYLKLAQCPVGLLINFNVDLLKNGIKRLVL
ncbi:MAG: GxxExxY protein [Phycisphaeraceae bacterium]|nr:GxxExxY protein [Phycisphaeraceae bacterium]